MRQIGLYAMVLGLLTCAVAARAQTYNVTTTVVNAPGAQILVIGINKPVVPYTADNNGTVQQMTLDFANNPNKTVEITVDQCDNNPPIVYVVYPGAAPPPEEPNCRRRRLAAVYIPGSGTLLIDLDKGTATFTPTPGPEAAVGEGPAPVTVEVGLAGGAVTAGNLSTASAIEGDIAILFGPGIGFAAGFVRSGDSTGHVTVSGSTPGTSTQVPFTASFHAGEAKGVVRVLTVGPFSVDLQGGAWLGTARETTSFTIVVTNPTGGTSTQVVTQTRTQGFVAPEFGGDVQVGLTRFLAAMLAIKRAYLRQDNSLNQGVWMAVAGVSFSPARARGFVRKSIHF